MTPADPVHPEKPAGPSDTPGLLRLEGLDLSYDAGQRRIFTGLSLQVDEGQAIVLSGASGVGKSTLLRSMAGLDARVCGSLYWRDTEVLAKEVPAFRQQAIYVAQSSPRLPMSVEDSLRAAFEFRHQRRNYDREHALELCQELLLSEKLLPQRLTDLSGGEAQRFALIRALLLKPQLLLLDEPASSLDSKTRDRLATVLAAWFGQGQHSLVIVSHEPTWCQDLATEHWTLRAGGTLESRAASA